MVAPKELGLLERCKNNLDSFQASKSAFRLIATVNPSISPVHQSHPPRTLFILDSSYNPPSRAHASLATSAAHAAAAPLDPGDIPSSKRVGTRIQTKDGSWKYPGPARLLLLFSTANADKAAKPAAFEHRLATMVLFAEDLAARLNSEFSAPSASQNASQALPVPSPPAIDIGLTTEPIYHAKSAAITAAASESTIITDDAPAPNDHNPVQPSIYAQAQHIHLVGYDTIIRIFNAKYYKGHTPPLSALNSYFSTHGFRVTVRPTADTQTETQSDEDEELQMQLRWSEDNLASGRLEGDGGRREWADRVEMVRAHDGDDGDVGDVSSTRIREAAVSMDEEALRRCCPPRVARWVLDFGLYQEGET